MSAILITFEEILLSCSVIIGIIINLHDTFEV